MSKKKILFWTTSLLAMGSSVVSLGVCSCSQEETLVAPTSSNRQFKLTRLRDESGLPFSGKYIFDLGGFKVNNLDTIGKWRASATLIVGDDRIPLSHNDVKIDAEGNLTVSLVSSDWNELIAISPADVAYEIVDLSIRHKGKEMLMDKEGFSVMIKTGFAAPSFKGTSPYGSELSCPEGDNDDFYIPYDCGTDTYGALELCNADDSFDDSKIKAEIHPADSSFTDTFKFTNMCVVDPEAYPDLYYMHLAFHCQTGAAPADGAKTVLKIKVFNADHPEIVYYENDGLGVNGEFIFTVTFESWSC